MVIDFVVVKSLRCQTVWNEWHAAMHVIKLVVALLLTLVCHNYGGKEGVNAARYTYKSLDYRDMHLLETESVPWLLFTEIVLDICGGILFSLQVWHECNQPITSQIASSLVKLFLFCHGKYSIKWINWNHLKEMH